MNYGEILFQGILQTDFIKKKYLVFVIGIIASLVSSLLITITTALVSIHPVFDYIFQIGVSCIISLHYDYIFDAITRYKSEIFDVIQILINGYSPSKFRFYKRIFVSMVCASLILVPYFIKFNIPVLVSQYWISFFILEIHHEGYLKLIIAKFKSRPQIKIHTHETHMVESYQGDIIPQEKIISLTGSLTDPIHKK